MTTTPLDAHRQANATSPDLAEALSTIAERGVEFVYFQAITITGRVSTDSPRGRGLRLPPLWPQAQRVFAPLRHARRAERPVQRSQRFFGQLRPGGIASCVPLT